MHPVADLGVMHGGGQAPFPSLTLSTLRSRNPLIAARWSGGTLKLPQRVRAKPGHQTYFGEFLGIILHLFECLNDEFLGICSPFEGRFHSIDAIARCGHFL